MASSEKNIHARTQSYFLTQQEDEDNPISSIGGGHSLEFEEADFWNNFSSGPIVETTKNKVSSSRPYNGRNRMDAAEGCASSLPVNIPDWSKIYRKDRDQKTETNDDDDTDFDDDQDDDDDDDPDPEGLRVPPHEFLARRRGASFSVHEGVGRTLKGRDLRQVRNAIWKKVGFED